ncbi:MAG: amidase [Pseudomonadota bacterium]
MGAFTEYCDPHTDQVAERQSATSQVLAGATVGVKDIIDVSGVPTRNGSQTCRDASPAQTDAPVVAALRRAGAQIIGKTTTTEFAFTDPTDCRNPYDLARSPGGSSSGSGAAVAAGMVNMALGTQTAGSLCRPAAYCGAVGFKPSYGVLSTAGVTPLAPRFDTVGIIAKSVDLAGRAFHSMHGANDVSLANDLSACRLASLLLDRGMQVPAENLAAFEESTVAMVRFSAGVGGPEIPIDVTEIVADHRVVMNRQAFEAHGHLLQEEFSGLVGPRFSAGLKAGSIVTSAELDGAVGRLEEAKSVFWSALSGIDIVLTLPVPEGAPLLDGTTGFQDWLTPWTVFGGPLVCLPWGLDSLGRPRSVMLAAHPGADATLLGMAAALEREAPALPPPQPPEG